MGGDPKESNKSPPKAPKDWRSANGLRYDEVAGGSQALNLKLVELRRTLINDITAAGIGESEAEAIVDHNLVGLRKPVRGPAALYGSPEAIAMLDLQKTIHPTTTIAPPGWRSGNKLKSYFGGNEILTRKLIAFRASLIDDITAAGIRESEAEAIVDHNLIGVKRSGKREAYHGSPDAISMMEREAIIRRKNSCDADLEAQDGHFEGSKRSL